MRILYYNCSAGISGDMNLAALIDLGADERYLVGELQKLGIDGWRFSTVKDQRNGIWGTRAIVECAGGTRRRTFFEFGVFDCRAAVGFRDSYLCRFGESRQCKKS